MTPIAVLMATYGCRRTLPIAIESVLAQREADVGLFVLDDGGGDVDDALVARYPEATYIWLEQRRGPYAALNVALALTCSDLVAVHDADDRSHPDRFRHQLELLDRRIDICGTWSVLSDEQGRPRVTHVPPREATNLVLGGIKGALRHPTTMMRRELLDFVGGFDAATRFGADTEFHYRAALAGARIGNVPQVLYRRTVRVDSLTESRTTGFGSPARRRYQRTLRGRMAAIRDGHVALPEPGRLLDGTPAGTADLTNVAGLRAGARRQMLKMSALVGARTV